MSQLKKSVKINTGIYIDSTVLQNINNPITKSTHVLRNHTRFNVFLKIIIYYVFSHLAEINFFYVLHVSLYNMLEECSFKLFSLFYINYFS